MRPEVKDLHVSVVNRLVECISEVRLEIKGPKRRWAAVVALTCLLAAACSRTPRPDSGRPAGVLDFTLVNLTGSTLHAIYVSPHDSAGWGENLLGQDFLLDGENVRIRFSPEERTALWDLRVEDKDGNYSEWKGLDLREISKLTLRVGGGKDVMTAEAE